MDNHLFTTYLKMKGGYNLLIIHSTKIAKASIASEIKMTFSTKSTLQGHTFGFTFIFTTKARSSKCVTILLTTTASCFHICHLYTNQNLKRKSYINASSLSFILFGWDWLDTIFKEKNIFLISFYLPYILKIILFHSLLYTYHIFLKWISILILFALLTD